MDFSFVTGTESIHGDRCVYPENVNAVDCNLRSPVTDDGSSSFWPLCFFSHLFLRLSIMAALANKNADIISTKEGLCDGWKQVPELKQHG